MSNGRQRRWHALITAAVAGIVLLTACSQQSGGAGAAATTAPAAATSAPAAAPTPAAPAATTAAAAAPTTPAASATSAPAAATSAPAAGATTAPATGGAVTACPPSGAANELTGAGATFPAPLYTRWFDEYKKICNVQVNYQAIGSGGGIKQHTEKTVDFGASDGILNADQFSAAPGTIMIPMTAGAEAIIFNLEGVQSGQIKLTPETLAGIYLGKIITWNDPLIQADNAGMTLPDNDITVVHRSDGSGTTFIFTDYLSKVSPDWKGQVGSGTSVKWPAGVGGQGNAGVAGQVKQVPGAIGYVELAYAIQNNLTWASMKNQGGQFVEPSIEATTVAMNGVELPDNMQIMLTNSADPKAYPIAGFTWILVYKEQKDPAKAQTLAHLLWWNIHDGQKFSAELEYAPLSDKAVAKAEALIKQITVNGQPVIK